MPIDMTLTKIESHQQRKSLHKHINLPMQHPWPRIVGDEADSRTITDLASGYGITYDRVGIVISATSSTSDDRKGVL
jgi:hypothetical protein